MASAYFAAHFSGGHQQLSCFIPIPQSPPGPTARSHAHLLQTPASSCPHATLSFFSLSSLPYASSSFSTLSFLLLVFVSCSVPLHQRGGLRAQCYETLGSGCSLSLNLALSLTGLVSLRFGFFICNTDGAIQGINETMYREIITQAWSVVSTQALVVNVMTENRLH